MKFYLDTSVLLQKYVRETGVSGCEVFALAGL